MPILSINWLLGLSKILIVIAEFSLLIPLWIGYQRRHFLKQHHRIILWCCFMWFILTGVGQILHTIKQPNIIVWNIVTILETYFLGSAFYLVLSSPKTRLFLRIAAVIFAVVAVTDFFYLNGLRATTIYTVAFESALLVAIVLLYFEQLLQELRTIPLERNPMFLIGIGVIMYFAGTVMIFILQNSVTGSQEIIMMMINSILSIALNCIIARAFWLVGREQMQPDKAL